MENVLTVTQLAQKTGYSVAWIRRQCQQGRIKATKIQGIGYLIAEKVADRLERKPLKNKS